MENIYVICNKINLCLLFFFCFRQNFYNSNSIFQIFLGHVLRVFQWYEKNWWKTHMLVNKTVFISKVKLIFHNFENLNFLRPSSLLILLLDEFPWLALKLQRIDVPATIFYWIKIIEIYINKKERLFQQFNNFKNFQYFFLIFFIFKFIIVLY